MGDTLSKLLEPIASQFRSLNLPEPITHWGHPLMMGIVMFVMGSFVAYAGWQIRLNPDQEIVAKSKSDHRKIAPLMFLFMAMGYTGGILSLVMQEKSILASPHFWTGSIVLTLLAINGGLSLSGFAGNNPNIKSAHAYLGSIAVGIMVLHAIFGLKLGLSI